jgi:predicted N-formylglutamate amidohydrolase
VDSEDYVEIIGGTPDAPVLFTCEHASERFPPPFAWPDADRWLGGTHWAYDLGARELAHDLSRETRAVSVLSRFSRLLADPNRPEGAPEIFRTIAEGRTVTLNASLDAEERERRLELWRAYHATVDREVARSTANVILAVHTFTPVYEGAPRTVEVGVLFDEETALAEKLRFAVEKAGFNVAMNEPYSGKAGLMYSVDRHARRHGRKPIELEFRQDLAVAAASRARLVAGVRAFLDAL